MSSSNIKKIIIAIVVLLVLGVGGYMFLGNASTIPVSVIVPQEDGAVGQDVLVLINKLKSASIDSSIFSSALFINLNNTSIPLNPEQQGRLNPFALIGVEQ